MIVAMTGHRPEKIKASQDEMEEYLIEAFTFLKADYIIQGMASGIDLWSARAAYHAGIQFECAVPWKGHRPRKEDAPDYYRALDFADKVTYVNDSEEYLGPWLYQRRNEYMVDNAENVLAVWDGTNGGTKNCVDYALKIKAPTWRLDPNNLKAALEWL